MTDYLQLAGLGRHSVEIDVDQRGEPFGSIVVYEGEPWTAIDASGSGGEAFMRMLAAADLTFECTPPPKERPVRSLDGTCESILLETARLLDERRSGMAPEPARTRTERLQMPARSPAPLRPALSAATEFEQLYADGIDAVLAKKYTEALALFLRAKTIRSTPTLEANLNRLRTMGIT